MATLSICGSTCSISVDGVSNFEGHRYTLTGNAPDIDVRRFGSGQWGEFKTCIKEATIDLESYLWIDSLEPGDECSIKLDVGPSGSGGTAVTKHYVIPHCKCTNCTINVDAKDIVGYSYQFRVSDDITGW